MRGSVLTLTKDDVELFRKNLERRVSELTKALERGDLPEVRRCAEDVGELAYAIDLLDMTEDRKELEKIVDGRAKPDDRVEISKKTKAWTANLDFRGEEIEFVVETDADGREEERLSTAIADARRLASGASDRVEFEARLSKLLADAGFRLKRPEYKVYEIGSKAGYYGTLLVGAESVEDANRIVTEFRKRDPYNRMDSFAILPAKESDLLEGATSTFRGIIRNGIVYSG